MDQEEKDLREKEMLGGFHSTMASQLNSRLTESPKFFGLVVVALTAYGFVIWNWHQGSGGFILVLSSGAVYLVLLWAVWYLSALSYAFRFLQYSLHRSEEALGWQKYRLSDTWEVSGTFGLAPGIYHAHLGGLVFVVTMLCIVFGYILHSWLTQPMSVAILTGSSAFLIAVGWAYAVNQYYASKFNTKVCKKRTTSSKP